MLPLTTGNILPIQSGNLWWFEQFLTGNNLPVGFALRAHLVQCLALRKKVVVNPPDVLVVELILVRRLSVSSSLSKPALVDEALDQIANLPWLYSSFQRHKFLGRADAFVALVLSEDIGDPKLSRSYTGVSAHGVE